MNTGYYTLEDTFNGRCISRHRTLRGAVRAQRRFSTAIERANGRGHYIPTTILRDGTRLSEDEQNEVFDLMMGRLP